MDIFSQFNLPFLSLFEGKNPSSSSPSASSDVFVSEDD